MSRRREWTLRLIMIGISLFVGLGLAELTARILHPISDGRDNVALDGTRSRAGSPPARSTARSRTNTTR